MGSMHTEWIYQHTTIEATAAAATLKTMFPGRPVRVKGIGVTAKVAYVLGTTTTSKITIDKAIQGTTTGTVADTLAMTVAMDIGDHVYLDMEGDGTAFEVEPGENWNLKTAVKNDGGTITGQFDIYVYGEYLGFRSVADKDFRYNQ